MKATQLLRSLRHSNHRTARVLLPLLSLLFSAPWPTLRADLRTSVQQVQQALLAIDYFYVDTVDDAHLAETAVRAMLRELDPHSTYLTPDEVRAMTEDLGGQFDGIGVRYQMERDTLLVLGTVAGGPSERVGIQAGDRIVTVDDTLIAGVGMPTREIQRRLRGPRGTCVRLGIRRAEGRGESAEEGLLTFLVTRDKIPVHSVEAAYMAAPGVGYVKVARFAQTTPAEVAEAMDRLSTQGMEHLIIDLQDNGGGYLQSAVGLANPFLPRGTGVVYTIGRTERRRDYTTAGGRKMAGRLVVLIDEESASASEIFSGAIQDHDRGVIVGRRSFGKGLVQRPVDLPDGAMVRLTTSHYYTPSGRCIQKPYTQGEPGAYARDIADRYRHGEVYSPDSIRFADSLRYLTDAGRTVYGGGGIMPDVFVPLDTAQTPPTLRRLVARGTLHRFVLEYFSRHQRALRQAYPTAERYIENFDVPQTMVDTLMARAAADSVRIDSLELAQSLPRLRLQLKAALAADLFEPGTFYRITNTESPIYSRALAIISDADEYLRLLRPQPEAE